MGLTVHNEQATIEALLDGASIARYGDGWEDYWADLVDGGVTVSSGWSEAYYTEYAAGGGEKSIVVSYATSPPADVLFADPPVDAAVSAVLDV